MPKLRKNDVHKCLLCDYSSKRGNIKTHLTTIGKKGVRCPGLLTVIPSDVWVKLVEFYAKDKPAPDLSGYCKKSPARKKLGILKLNKRSRKRRLSLDGEIKECGKSRLSRADLLELLRHTGDTDTMWLAAEIQEHGASAIRRLITCARKYKKPQKMEAPRLFFDSK